MLCRLSQLTESNQNSICVLARDTHNQLQPLDLLLLYSMCILLLCCLWFFVVSLSLPFFLLLLSFGGPLFGCKRRHCSDEIIHSFIIFNESNYARIEWNENETARKLLFFFVRLYFRKKVHFFLFAQSYFFFLFCHPAVPFHRRFIR